MKQEINNEINLVVDLNVEDDNDNDEVQITGQTPFHPRNRLARLKKLKQIKDDLDKEIEFIVIDDDENEIEETGYVPPPLVRSRERLKTFNKMLEKVDSEIEYLVKRLFIKEEDWKELKKVKK